MNADVAGHHARAGAAVRGACQRGDLGDLDLLLDVDGVGGPGGCGGGGGDGVGGLAGAVQPPSRPGGQEALLTQLPLPQHL